MMVLSATFSISVLCLLMNKKYVSIGSLSLKGAANVGSVMRAAGCYGLLGFA